MRKGLITTLLIIGACIVPEHGQAALNDQYPTDADGVLVDPGIDALATQIVGRPYSISCTPDPQDGTAGRTWFGGTGNEDGTITWDSPTSSELNGDLCGLVDKLLHYSPGYFKRDVWIAPIAKPGSKKQKNPINIGLPDERSLDAAYALLALEHEAIHAALAPAPFTTGDDEQAPPFDEGLVECTALRNMWPTIASLHLPAWLNKQLLAGARIAHEGLPDDYRTVC